MRTLLLGDISAAARALLNVPVQSRLSLLDTMIQQADAAHDYHKRLRRPHPLWGNGSLMARANVELQVMEPFASNIAYLDALQIVICTLISRKRGAKMCQK